MTDERTVGMMAEHIKRSQEEHDIIWNAAIEAAAELVLDYGPYNEDKAEQIRKLKK